LRKLIQLKTASHDSPVTNKWVQHLVQRLIVNQLNLSPLLQAKMLRETSKLYDKETSRK
jgi:hypothetical protein